MPTRKLLTISLPPAFLKDLERMARVERRTKSELVREALRRYAHDFELSRFRRQAIKSLGSRPLPTQREIVRMVKEVRRGQAKERKTG